jgi:probable rRNA maturation factor
MTRATPAAIAIDVIVASERWREPEKAEAIVRRAVTAAAAATLSITAAELAIVLADDSAIRVLNRDWRGVDASTNVLSFPTAKTRGHHSGRHLGDIVLAFDTIAREARGERKPLAHHIAHLAVHGFLHLIGYDHENDEDAAAMEQTERGILHGLSVPDPYRPRKTAVSLGKTAKKKTARVKAAKRPVKKAAGRLRKS